MAMHFLSHAEQLAAHLRSGILAGRWSGSMPGVLRLEAELGINRNTIEAALKLLEKEGLLKGQGAGRKRQIVVPEGQAAPALRVAILLYEKDDQKLDYVVDLQHQLAEAGQIASFASKTLIDLGMDVKRIARFVKRTEVDAWVILGGSHEVLKWFAAGPLPALALFGRFRQLAIASSGIDKAPAIVTAVRQLVELGHRRIVMLVREEQRKPHVGELGRAFLEELEAQGIQTSPYNLPDWEDDLQGFHRCLDALFERTPPTALVLDEAPFFVAALQHLARRGIVAPEQVSLVCQDPGAAFAWCEPSIAHITWDPRPVVRRIVRWANRVSRGKEDLRQTLTKAEFVEGGTVGRAPVAE